MNTEQFKVSKSANLPTRFGNFVIQAFMEEKIKENKHYILEHLVIKTQEMPEIPYVRVHSECLTGDALGSLKCDCGGELALALERIYRDGGMVIYLRQEGRGIGLFNKVNAYALQDLGMDTVEANLALGFREDEREYSIVKFILDYYKLREIKLLTNNPSKISVFEEMVKLTREPIIATNNKYNEGYLNVKKQKMGHLL